MLFTNIVNPIFLVLFSLIRVNSLISRISSPSYNTSNKNDPDTLDSNDTAGTFVSSIALNSSASNTERNATKHYMLKFDVDDNADEFDDFCEHILPATEKLFQAVDITNFDLRHDYAFEDRDGFTEEILEMTCRKKRKRIINEQKYDLPDQVQSIYTLDTGLFYPIISEPRLYENFGQFKRDLSYKLGLDDTIKGYYSTSGSIKQLQTRLLENNKLLIHIEATVPLWRTNMVSKRIMRRHLTEYFREYLDLHRKTKHSPPTNNITNEDTKPNIDFVTTFGTHYFSSATFGGVIDCWIELNSSLRSEMSQEDLRNNALTIFTKILREHNSTAATATANRVVDPKFLSSHTLTLNVYGGEVALFHRSKYDAWRKSLTINPIIIKGNLQPLADLAVYGNSSRDNLRRSTDLYLGLKYLQESRRLLKIYLRVLPQRVRESIQNSLDRIDKANKPSASAQYIMKLVQDL